MTTGAWMPAIRPLPRKVKSGGKPKMVWPCDTCWVSPRHIASTARVAMKGVSRSTVTEVPLTTPTKAATPRDRATADHPAEGPDGQSHQDPHQAAPPQLLHRVGRNQPRQGDVRPHAEV